jgi:hypothetical protein
MKFWRRIKTVGQKPFLDAAEKIADGYVDNQRPAYLRYALIALLIVGLLLLGLGWYWSNEPKLFDVRAEAQKALAGKPLIVGVTTTSTLIHTKANREAFSRSQSQSTEDPDLAMAEPRLHIDHNSWAVPWPESEYAEGQQYFRNYLERLADSQSPDAQFFARADNLRYWLSTVETRLGSLSQRLSASVGQRRINTDLSGDAAGRQSTQNAIEIDVKTSWLEIDNVFYEARGTTWALLHFLKAVEVDFADVLNRKNAITSLQQIIRELEMSQQPVNAPVIVNGEGFGLLANHSLVMASYISRANAAIIDLRELLSQG